MCFVYGAQQPSKNRVTKHFLNVERTHLEFEWPRMKIWRVFRVAGRLAPCRSARGPSISSSLVGGGRGGGEHHVDCQTTPRGKRELQIIVKLNRSRSRLLAVTSLVPIRIIRKCKAVRLLFEWCIVIFTLD